MDAKVNRYYPRPRGGFSNLTLPSGERVLLSVVDGSIRVHKLLLWGRIPGRTLFVGDANHVSDVAAAREPKLAELPVDAFFDDMIGRLATLQASETMLSWCTRLALTARDLDDCARIFARASATPAPPRQEQENDPVWPPPGPDGELAVIRVAFDSGSGICLWTGNKVADRFYGGGAIELFRLPLSYDVELNLKGLIEEEEGSEGWTAEERAAFRARAREWIARLRAEAGHAVIIINAMDDVPETPPVVPDDGEKLPRVRFFFDAGSGYCMWSANTAARRELGDYEVHLAILELPKALQDEGEALIQRQYTSIDWDDPFNGKPWTDEQHAAFDAETNDWLARVRAALDGKVVIDDAR